MQIYEGYAEKGVIYPITPLAGIQGRRRAIITILDEPTSEKSKKSKRPRKELKGSLKGKIWTSDDFDAPMDEFMEYM